MNRILTAALLLAASATMAVAAEASKTKILAVELTSGTADIATESSTGFTGFSPAFDHSEWGGRLEYWNMMGPDYALTAGAGIGTFSEEDKPGSNALAGDKTAKFTQSSWNLRLGGDRVVKLSERSILYFGPGIEYWSGKAKFENIVVDASQPGVIIPSYETKNTTRISLDARIGGHLMVSPNWGLTAQVGTKVGHANYEENGSKTTWWPSSMSGALGLAFGF